MPRPLSRPAALGRPAVLHPLNPTMCLPLQQVCCALRHAHRRGVAHRDLKLENILMTKPSSPDEPVRLTTTSG